MKNVAAIASAILVFAVSTTSRSADKQASRVPFALSLTAVDSRVRIGTVPQFRLTLTNVSGRSARILKIAERVDLQHTYFELTVTRDGKRVEVPIAVSDPGPISETDWVEVPPGTMKTFTLKHFPELYERLPPGIYQAHVRFWRDPLQGYETAYDSEVASFTVVE